MIYHHMINETHQQSSNVRKFQQITVQYRRITCCGVEWSTRRENMEQKSIATPEPGPTRLASPNQNPEDARLIFLFYILLSFLFQKCRDPNPRADPNGGSEPEPGLLRRFHLSYQNILLICLVAEAVSVLGKPIIIYTFKAIR